MYDIHEPISQMISIAQVHRDSIKLQESLDDFITNFASYDEFGDESHLRNLFNVVKEVRLMFYRMILTQSNVAVRKIELNYENERAARVDPRLTQPMKAETDPV